MSPKAASVRPGSPDANLAPGQVVGGRFVVERLAFEDALGAFLLSRDQKTNKPIALRVLAPGLIEGEEAMTQLRQACKTAAALTHPNIVATYGVGTAPNRRPYVACEWVNGVSLTERLTKRQQEGEPILSLRGAYNVVAHVCTALTYAHRSAVHGALRPSLVWISGAGRVKISDFGVARVALRAAGLTRLSADEQACLAPEVRAGSEPTSRSDMFGLGALLYMLLTGRSPAHDFMPPSKARPDATKAMDEVLLRCLAREPSARFNSPSELRRALLALVAEAPSSEFKSELGVEVDVDVDVGSIPPPPLPHTRPAAPVPPPAKLPKPPGPPKLTKRPKPAEAPAIAAPAIAQPATATPAVQAAATVDLAGLLAKITENDAPRWMAVKNNLDHGPFSGRELVEMMLKGDVTEEHGLLNMDTGERRKARDYPEFTEFLEQYQIRKRDEQEKAQLAQSEKRETVSNVVKLFIALAALAVIGGAIGVFLYTRGAARKEQVANAELADLFERGAVEISGTAGILPDPPRRAGSRARSTPRRTGSNGPSAGGSLSYDEAMNEAVSLGDATKSGGERRLSPGEVADVMNRHINSLFSCVSEELRRGTSLGNVQIDLAIAGSGSVLGASVRQGSPGFRTCIERRVRSVRFPGFEAPRMGARYSFAVD